MNLFEYMQNNPWMTFFILLGTVTAIKYLAGGLVVMIKGYPPEHTNALGLRRDEE